MQPLHARLESREKSETKPSFGDLKKMAAQIDCPKCRAGLERVPRFKIPRYGATGIMLVTVALRLMGVIGTAVALMALTPCLLVGIALRFWDNKYPRVEVLTK